MSQQTASHTPPRGNRLSVGEAPLTVEGRWLIAARAIWVLIAVAGIALFILGVPLRYQGLLTPCVATDCVEGQLTPDALQALLDAGISPQGYAFLLVGLPTLLALVYVGVGLLIFWRRAHEWMALIGSLWLITFGVTLFEGEVRAVGSSYPMLQPLVLFLIFIGGVILLALFFFIFPNGRFVPRWTRWVWLLTVTFFSIMESIRTFESIRLRWPDEYAAYNQYGTSLWGIMILGGISAQFYRYIRISGPKERQQTKWVIFALLGTFLGILVLFAFDAPGPLLGRPDLNVATTYALQTTLGTVAFLPIPLGIGVSILRYRLWDIDILIRRTLQYSIVSALLAIVYSGTVTLLQSGITTVTNAQSPVAIVISTLFIAALFNPLRSRVQAFVDRRFFRRKYDAQQILAQFAQSARDEVSLEVLTVELTSVIGEAMQPEQVTLWLKTDDTQ